jgi:hypothetical protein
MVADFHLYTTTGPIFTFPASNITQVELKQEQQGMGPQGK